MKICNLPSLDRSPMGCVLSINQARWKYGADTLKKIKGCPQMQQPEQRGLLVTMLNPSRRAGGRK